MLLAAHSKVIPKVLQEQQTQDKYNTFMPPTLRISSTCETSSRFILTFFENSYYSYYSLTQSGRPSSSLDRRCGRVISTAIIYMLVYRGVLKCDS